MITKQPQDFGAGTYDAEGQALVIISEPHAMNHRGKAFHTTHKFTGVADAASVEILIKVGVDELHMNRFAVSVGSGDIDIFLFEGTTVSGDGTSLGEVCTNREAAATAITTFFHTPTVTGDGTQIAQHWIPPTGTGIGNSLTGVAGAENGEEWELDASTNYLHRITNNSGSTIDIFVEYLWYETDV